MQFLKSRAGCGEHHSSVALILAGARYTWQVYFSAMNFPNASEAALANLIHDLRQPLGNIETSMWCLSSLMGSADPKVREHVAIIERQVEAAEMLLASAAAELNRARVQRAEAAINLEMTRSAS